MRSGFGWLFIGLAACTNVSTQDSGSPPPEPAPAVISPPAAPPAVATPATPTPPAEPTPAATPAATTVQMTAVTLADDCGGPPAAPKAKQDASSAMKGKQAPQRCKQSSMQLSVVAAAGGAASQLAVKKVELFDDKGALIGELTARAPSVWGADGTYQAWDQRIAPGQDLSVSYALSQPPWGDVPDRRSRGYVLKAVFTVGDGEQAVQREVQVDAPTTLPPNVKT